MRPATVESMPTPLSRTVNRTPAGAPPANIFAARSTRLESRASTEISIQPYPAGIAFDGIEHEVEHELLDAGRVGIDQWDALAYRNLQLDCAGDGGPKERQRVLHDLVDGERPLLNGGFAPCPDHLVDECPAPLGRALDADEVIAGFGVVHQLTRELGVGSDGDEVVPQLVPYTDGHLADGREALKLANPVAGAGSAFASKPARRTAFGGGFALSALMSGYQRRWPDEVRRYR